MKRSTSADTFTAKATLLPMDFIPSPHDVLCGRGNAYATRPGNRLFSDICREHLPEYERCPKRMDKSVIVANAVKQVLDNGSRFIKRVNGVWYQMSAEQAHDKTGHAIRDMLRLEQQQQQQPQPQHGNSNSNSRKFTIPTSIKMAASTGRGIQPMRPSNPIPSTVQSSSSSSSSSSSQQEPRRNTRRSSLLSALSLSTITGGYCTTAATTSSRGVSDYEEMSIAYCGTMAAQEQQQDRRESTDSIFHAVMNEVHDLLFKGEQQSEQSSLDFFDDTPIDSRRRSTAIFFPFMFDDAINNNNNMTTSTSAGTAMGTATATRTNHLQAADDYMKVLDILSDNDEDNDYDNHHGENVTTTNFDHFLSTSPLMAHI